MGGKVDFNILRKYLDGQYSFQELKEIKRWFAKPRHHEELKSAIKNHWDEFEGIVNTEKDLSDVFFQIKQQILAEEQKHRFIHNIRFCYSRIAGVLLIPLLIYSAFSLLHQLFPDNGKDATWVEISSPNGTRTHFELPDGTKVCMNGGAYVKYKTNFKKDRQLTLEGEAYFDVFHDSSSPFTVHADFIDVTALGTKFSVASLNEGNIKEVILEEGEVRLDNKEKSFARLLKPNEKFYFDNRDQKWKTQKVDAQYLTSWKDNLLMFRSEPLREVMRRIEHWYNVRVEITDPELEQLRYRATFEDEPLEEVLRLISMTAPIDYEIKRRTITNKNQYNEKIVIIKIKD